MLNLEHISSQNKPISKRKIEARIARIQSGNHFSINKIENLRRHLDRKAQLIKTEIRKPICHLTTSPGMGISTMIERLIQKYPAETSANHGCITFPIMKLHLPPTYDFRDFSYEICEITRAPARMGNPSIGSSTNSFGIL